MTMNISKGTDGTGGGGHHHKSRIPDASKFPFQSTRWKTCKQFKILCSQTTRWQGFDDEYESYVFRGLVDYGGNRMVVDVAIDRWGTPSNDLPGEWRQRET